MKLSPLSRFVRVVGLIAAIAGKTYSQTSATTTIDHGEVTAGDPLTVTLIFDKAATCSAQIDYRLREGSTQSFLYFAGNLEAGKSTAAVRTVVPKDKAGKFDNFSSFLYPCEGYSERKEFKVDPLTVNVKPIPDPNTYPASAVATLELDQKQFLDTRATELRELISQIDTKVEEDGRDSPELRSFLAITVTSAHTLLQRAQKEYIVKIMNGKVPAPPFFADFERQYGHLLEELKAPIPGMQALHRQESFRLLDVQQPLNRRLSTAKGRNLAGTSPAIARAVKQSISDNASAYDIVKDTNRPTPLFHARFSSLPTGATLFYRQAIEPEFQRWSKITEISGADFDLATFVFKFHKDECEDEPVRTVEPYSDTHPDISVEFKRCSKR